MIKAIVFDCFGVLTSDGWLTFRDTYFADPALREQASVANVRVDAGLISYKDFIQEIARLSHRSEREVQTVLESHQPNEKLFQYIRDELAPRYQLGLLSNAAKNWLGDIFDPWQVNLFKEKVLSYEIGTAKPDPRMYETICNRLGVLPHEAVFIDDQPYYVDGAKSIGMQGLHYTDLVTLKRDLKEMLDA